MTLFREALLERLVAKHAISEELKVKLLGWRHPGFSVHVGEPIPPNDTRAIEDVASYVVRNPVSLRRLVYIDGHNAVVYRALRTNPSLGANFVALDPVRCGNAVDATDRGDGAPVLIASEGLSLDRCHKPCSFSSSRSPAG